MQKRISVKRFLNFTLALIMALSLIAAAMPQPAQAATTASCAETHVVKAGETIWRIAKDYDMTANRIAKTNGLVYPYPLTVGQSLCIPDTSPASSNAKWTGTYTNGKVAVEGSGFKKNYSFFLKVRENDTSDWYKLGKFTSDKKGVIDESFKLPKDIQKKTSLMVCLKDAGTDALVCKKVYRQ